MVPYRQAAVLALLSRPLAASQRRTAPVAQSGDESRKARRALGGQGAVGQREERAAEAIPQAPARLREPDIGRLPPLQRSFRDPLLRAPRIGRARA